MTHFLGGGRIEDEQKLARNGNRAARAATLVTRLQAMQRQINAKHFAVLRLNSKGTGSARKLTCVLDNWGVAAEANAHDLVNAYGEELVAHLDQSLLPILWDGAGEHQAAELSELAPFAHRLKGRKLPYSGIAFPVRLGAQGNGYVVFAGSYVDASTEQVVDLHGRSCMIMTDLLAADEKRVAPAETLSDREIACLQMAGDGHISEEIAERMGLSVHTVNAYLGAATTKLDSVNRIQAIAKAIRLGYIS
ncbi:helix-turn-helix transcriptional regulator [Ensifer sp. PDNC004]|uniref:transcriptional regulator VisR n=1 Tax=unclassified Ensifer TaxID=2633371 RepID=UPI00177EBCFE|nr:MULTISPECIES: helix-turn-helix transcriptional regulator [unclassified Ensifer]MBD9649117.1 helix-turn-helix transcriptional regulator [Ensifer sp. ENS09]QRY66510.1 helix-turn-helix transcriptional regulator [Ensifer sp. PDNC004]